MPVLMNAWRLSAKWFVVVGFACVWPCGNTNAQIVQVPTIGTFSIQSAVSVPDSGSAYLGGNRSASSYSRSSGPMGRGGVSQMSAGAASVRATIIDLDELDRMIRSQATAKSTIPALKSEPTSPSKFPNAAKPKPEQAAVYEYLEALSHDHSKPDTKSYDAASYYLELAHAAKQKGHWHAVELYYKLAWKSLPTKRQAQAIESLARAKAAPNKN
jgi:hypothetical protein